MYKGIDEGFFLKNGQKSPLHCMKLQSTRSGFLSDVHYHNYIEILYGIDCEASVWNDGRIYEFKNGDLCFINPFETHFVSSERNNNEYFVIKFSPAILSYEGQMIAETKYLIPIVGNKKSFSTVIKKEELKDSDIGSIVRQIYKEWTDEKSGYEFAVRGYILRLFCEIIRVLEKNSGEKIFSRIDGRLVRIIHDSANFARENLLTVTEKEAAEFSNMSYSYFSRNFRTVMGRSFTGFINELKIDAAKRMLVTTEKSITEIAIESGYSSSSHFIANFRSILGVTPLSYKKSFEKNMKYVKKN